MYFETEAFWMIGRNKSQIEALVTQMPIYEAILHISDSHKLFS